MHLSEAEPLESRLNAHALASGAFFQTRWRGELPIGHVFWMDMLLYGTAINIVTTLAALLLFAADAPTALAATVYLSPLPYNLFLFVAVWRSAEKAREPWQSLARAAGFLWLMAAAVL